MRLSARKACHLDVSEIIVFGVVSRPSLDVVAGVGAAVQEGRHGLAVLFFMTVLQWATGLGSDDTGGPP